MFLTLTTDWLSWGLKRKYYRFAELKFPCIPYLHYNPVTLCLLPISITIWLKWFPLLLNRAEVTLFTDRKKNLCFNKTSFRT